MNATLKQATIPGLIAFINLQPAGKKINHESWETCAVGDYTRSIGQVEDFCLAPDTVLGQLYREAGSAEGFGDFIRETDGMSLMDVLQVAGARNWDTYGKLRTGLAKQFPLLGFIPDKLTAWTKFQEFIDRTFFRVSETMEHAFA